jgi:hypothetical protein
MIKQELKYDCWLSSVYFHAAYESEKLRLKITLNHIYNRAEAAIIHCTRQIMRVYGAKKKRLILKRLFNDHFFTTRF